MKLVHGTIALRLPGGWEDQTEVVLLGPGEIGEYRPSVVLVETETQVPFTPVQYAQLQTAELALAMGPEEFEILEEGPRTVSGCPAYSRVYNGIMASATGWRLLITQIQVNVILGRRVITFTGTDRRDRFSATRPAFESLLESLRFQASDAKRPSATATPLIATLEKRLASEIGREADACPLQRGNDDLKMKP